MKSVHILQERVSICSGYFRARLELANGDFMEVSEYFELCSDRVRTMEYPHQWMDSYRRVLRKRWDNAGHHPALAGFPHHIHVGEDSNVQQGQSLNIMDLLDLIESEIKGSCS